MTGFKINLEEQTGPQGTFYKMSAPRSHMTNFPLFLFGFFLCAYKTFWPFYERGSGPWDKFCHLPSMPTFLINLCYFPQHLSLNHWLVSKQTNLSSVTRGLYYLDPWITAWSRAFPIIHLLCRLNLNKLGLCLRHMLCNLYFFYPSYCNWDVIVTNTVSNIKGFCLYYYTMLA